MTFCSNDSQPDKQPFRTPLWRVSATTLSLVNAIMMAGAAHGQSTPQSQASTNAPAGATNAPAKLPDVVVRGQQQGFKPEALSSPKYTEPLRDVPQTVTVVPRAVIEQQGAATLRDVLRNVPGISFQAGEGGVPAGDNMTIRGFPARGDIFVDGIRDFGGYSRDSFNLDSVEVSKGPASSYTGRGSVGGSVNLVSKYPTLAPAYGGSFGLGTDEYNRATLDVNQPVADSPIAGTSLRLNGLWHSDHTPGRDEVKNQRWGIAPSVSFGLGTPTRVTLSYFQLQQDNLPDYGIPWVPANTNSSLARYSDDIPPVDYSNFYGLTTRDFETTRTYLPTGKVEHDFNDTFSLRNLTRYGRTDRDSVITAPRFVNANLSDTINRQIQSRDQEDTIVANQTDLTSRFETFKIDHALVTGLEFSREASQNYARTGAVSTTSLLNPNPNDPYPSEIRRSGAFAESEADSFAVSLFDTIKLTEQWQVVGGVRWDYFETAFAGHNTAGLKTNDLSRIDREWSYRGGLIYKPRPNGSIYFGYGTSFSPSAEGLTLSTASNALNNVETPPERVYSLELGTKWDLFHNRAQASFALFRTDKDNARTEDPNDPGDVVVLDGDQRVHGVEMQLAGNITEQWLVSGGYSFQHSEILKSRNPAEVGNELANTPQHTFTLWTTYALPWDLEIGGGARYTGSRFSANNNLREAPGYWLGEAMLAYHPTRNLTLRLNVYNLTDEEYIDRVGGGHIVPGPARSAVLTASLAF
jgi:catecholate siderophore receptor